MKRKLIKAAVTLGLLLTILIVGLLWNTTPLLKQLKPQLESIAAKAIGQSIDLGELSLRFLPSIAIESKGVILKGAKGADGAQQSADTVLGKLVLHARLLPLLKGAVEVSELALDGLKVEIVKKADGKLVVGGVPIGAKDSAKSAAPESATPPSNTPIALTINRASLKNSVISFRDEQGASGAKELRIEDLSLLVDGITPAGIESFELEASLLSTTRRNFSISGSAKRQTISSSAENSTKLSTPALPFTGKYDLAWKDISLPDLTQLLQASGSNLPPETLLQGAMSLTVSAAIPSSDIQSSDQEKNGKPSLQVRLDLTPASLKLQNQVEKSVGFPLIVDLSLSGGLPTITLDKSKLQLGKSTVNLGGELSPLTRSGSVKFQTEKLALADIAAISAQAKAFKTAGEITADIDIGSPGTGSVAPAIGKLQLSNVSFTLPGTPPADVASQNNRNEASGLEISELTATIDSSKDSILIKPLTLKIAGQPLELGAKVTSLSPLAGSLALQSTTLKLGEILSAINPGSAKALEGALLSALKITGAINQADKNGNLTLSFDSGTIAQLPIGQTKLSANLTLDDQGKPQTISLPPGSISIFGGNITLSGNLAHQQDLSLSVLGTTLDLQKLTAVAGVDGVTGSLDSLKTSLTGKLSALNSTLAGPVSAQASNGTLPGVNLLGQTFAGVKSIPGLGAALSDLVPEKYRPLLAANSTAYDRLTLVSNLSGPKINLSSLLLEHQLYKVTGSGFVGPESMEIKAQMRLTPVIVSGMVAREPKLKALLDREQNLVIPILIQRSSGGKTVVIPDVSDLGKRAFENVGREAGKKALDKVAPGLGSALDSLF